MTGAATDAARAAAPTAADRAATPEPSPASEHGPLGDPTRKAPKLKLPKPVHDTFTMPKAEHDLIDLLKVRASVRYLKKVRKSDILRAGVLALADMNDEQFFAAIDSVPPVKTGRR